VFRATGARLGPGRADQSFRVVEISPVAPFVLPQGLADSPLLGQEPLAVAEIEHPSTDREARARLDNQIGDQIAAAPPSAGEDGLLARRASLWRLLGFLLEHPDAAGGVVFYVQQVMTGRGLLVDQYWLLSPLHQAAQRAQDR
jgi:hypothetical protein